MHCWLFKHCTHSPNANAVDLDSFQYRNWSRGRLSAHSFQQKAGAKAKKIKEQSKTDQRKATNIKENFLFLCRFYMVWTGLKVCFVHVGFIKTDDTSHWYSIIGLNSEVMAFVKSSVDDAFAFGECEQGVEAHRSFLLFIPSSWNELKQGEKGTTYIRSESENVYVVCIGVHIIVVCLQ